MSLFVGLTGSMGAGKTLVAEIFRKRSAYILDADIMARNLVHPKQPVWQEIVNYFGKEILFENEEINRSQLGRIVFDDPEKKKFLEDILHPRIFKEERRAYGEIKDFDSKALVLLDAALLIESGNYKNMDKVLVVVCEKQESIRRLLKRDSFTKEEIEKRLGSQMKIDDKIKYADEVIDNNGSIEQLEGQVERIYQDLKHLL